MLEKPPIPDATIIATIADQFNIHLAALNFLPLGGDLGSALYRGDTADGTPYFVKLRSGEFDETSVDLPKFLHEQNIPQIIAPLTTRNGQLRADMDAHKVILYPFIEGKNAYEVELTDSQWDEFASALQKIHSVQLPPPLAARIERETFGPYWRDIVTALLERLETETYIDPIMQDAAAFLNDKRADIFFFIDHAKKLAQDLQADPPPFVLCHSDIHAGNVHITPHGPIYVVDWDYPRLAPRELDLLFIGGGQGYLAASPDIEEQKFFHGYGNIPVNYTALTYYRYERLCMDIGVETERVFSDKLIPQERAQSLQYIKWNWNPDWAVDRSRHVDQLRQLVVARSDLGDKAISTQQ